MCKNELRESESKDSPFRTLAIQERSSEVWRVLGAVKTEFGKFADVLAAVKKKIEEASNLSFGRDKSS